MSVFSIELPDRRVIDIEAGDQETAVRGAREWHRANPKPEMGWGEYLKGLGREAVQGATFDFGDELGLTDRAASQQFGEQHPVASTVARLAGGIPMFAAGPGAALGRAAMSGGLLRSTAKSAGLGAGAGGVAGLGGGEGDVFARLPAAAQGAMAGAVLGGAIPPAIAGVGRLANAAAPVLSPITARLQGAMTRRGEAPFPEPPPRRSAPIEGARFVDDSTITPGAEAQADQMLADQTLRSGRSIDDLRAMLGAADTDRSFYPGRSGGSRGADTATLADIDEGLAAMAGSAARASPEARRIIETFLAARQTGITPRAGRALSPQAGVETREPMLPRATNNKGIPTGPPAGQYERVHEGFKRAMAISDEDFHGHAGNPLRTEQQILRAARDEAKPLYDAAYAAGEGVDLRSAINPILQRWQEERLIQEPEPVQRAIRSLLRLFQSPTGDLRRFDKAKQFADGVIEKWVSAPEGRNRYVGGVLIELKNELLAAVDALPGAGPAYAKARAAFADRMTARDTLTRFRDAFREDSDVSADVFAALPSREQQKLARLGLLWGFEREAGKERTRDVTRFFNTPRVQDLLGRVMPSTGLEPGRASPADIAQRWGRFLETERAQFGMRQRVVGGSQTAERLADDAAFDGMQNVIEQFRNNPGVVQWGIAYAARQLNKLFGYRADTAEALATRLFVADPAARERVLDNIAKRAAPGRLQRFTQLMQEAQSRFGALASQAGGAAVGAPTPQPQQGGPTYL